MVQGRRTEKCAGEGPVHARAEKLALHLINEGGQEPRTNIDLIGFFGWVDSDDHSRASWNNAQDWFNEARNHFNRCPSGAGFNIPHRGQKGPLMIIDSLDQVPDTGPTSKRLKSLIVTAEEEKRSRTTYQGKMSTALHEAAEENRAKGKSEVLIRALETGSGDMAKLGDIHPSTLVLIEIEIAKAQAMGD